MTDIATADDYGVLTEPTTLRIERLLPGPAERVWRHLVQGDLRRRWFAGGGDMETQVGAPFELVWRNDELTDPPGQRPAGSPTEHRMQSRVIALDPLRRVEFAWGTEGATVAFELEPRGDSVLLAIVHRAVPDRASAVGFGTGWHAHLNVLAAILAGERPTPFWDDVDRLKVAYAARLPG